MFIAQLLCAILVAYNTEGRKQAEDLSPIGDFIDQMIKPYILFANQVINQSYTQPSLVVNRGDRRLLNGIEGDIETLIQKMTGHLKRKIKY